MASDNTSKLLKNLKNSAPKYVKFTPIATDIFLPNHSGAVKTPTMSKDIANKAYVDSAIEGSSGAENIGAAFMTSQFIASQAIEPLEVTKITIIDYALFNQQGWGDLTNKRYKPTQAGIYLIIARLTYSSTEAGKVYQTILSKTGSNYAISYDNSTTTDEKTIESMNLIYLNGTTDYVELYAWHNGTTTAYVAGDSTNKTTLQAIFMGPST